MKAVGDKELTQFKVGDSVRVKSGITDPDFQVEIGGWQGRILIVGPEANFAEVAWDSLTLAQMPKELLDLCFKEGYAVEGLTLTLDELEPAKARDTEKDVHNILAEIYGRYGLEYQTQTESLVLSMANLAGILEDDDDDW